MSEALLGRRILVPESRELELFAAMLEKAGATVLRCPMVTILDLDDDGPAQAWLRRLAGRGFDDVVLYTGEGLKRLLAIARRSGLDAEAIAALGAVRKIVRGPKPARVLREIGLAPDVTALFPTTAGLIETLDAVSINGRRVGLQAYPDHPLDLPDFLSARGAEVSVVVPYRYAAHEHDERVLGAIRAMAAGAVDTIAFTSTPQVRRMSEVAGRHGADQELQAAMGRVCAAAVGPITAAALEEAGWRNIRSPQDSFHLKPLITALREQS